MIGKRMRFLESLPLRQAPGDTHDPRRFGQSLFLRT